MYKEKWYHSPWVTGLLFALWILIIPPIIAIFLIVQRTKEKNESQKQWEESGIPDLIKVRAEIEKVENEYKQLSQKKESLMNDLKEFHPIIDLNETKQRLEHQLNDLTTKKETVLHELKDIASIENLIDAKKQLINYIDDLTNKKQDLSSQIIDLNQKVIVLEDEALMQSFGFYEPKYDFESSELYSAKLDDIRTEQKRLVKEKSATHHSLEWTIGNDKKKGREFILDTIKLTLRAFNNECDNIIMKVKFNNIDASEKRIKKVYEDLNKLTDMQQVSITRGYLDLKLVELYLKYEYEQKKQEEKEEQQAIKERMREEAKVLKEIEKAKEKIQKEENHFLQAISKAQEQLLNTSDDKKSDLEAKIKELEEQLATIQKQKENVDQREQNTRAGYVYIISNIGSFGENVYKIGMTRRLEPMDRVRELGDASVPFTFDVHAMIFSDDAPALENSLHKAFHHKRVNKVNERKEYFCVSLKEIEDVVKRNHNRVVEFTKIAEAQEYRQTLMMNKQTA
ncbi:DUF4041 domain-containing protein [Aneurinibacillus sp. REN35]|uniref:DUF4041 domain-containing protein n=1 Tax=Aneurinibacillus sp. REN35 TaxID=3237286 RepID=UPI003526E61B